MILLNFIKYNLSKDKMIENNEENDKENEKIINKDADNINVGEEIKVNTSKKGLIILAVSIILIIVA